MVFAVPFMRFPDPPRITLNSPVESVFPCPPIVKEEFAIPLIVLLIPQKREVNLEEIVFARPPIILEFSAPTRRLAIPPMIEDIVTSVTSFDSAFVLIEPSTVTFPSGVAVTVTIVFGSIFP